MRIGATLKASTVFIIINCVYGCASLTGYPNDPLSSDADLATIRAYAGQDAVAQYLAQSDPFQRQAIRDQIVYARLAAYDIEYQNFREALNRESNLQSLTGDFTLLILNGLGATTGVAATKAALAAASAGVVGATAAVNKDIFFNQALPAVVAQMDTTRTNQLLVIQEQLKKPDALYPLPRALLDAYAYRAAGTLPNAISILTANVNKAKAEAKSASLAPLFGQASAPVTEDTFVSPQRVGRVTARPPPVRPSESFYRNLP